MSPFVDDILKNILWIKFFVYFGCNFMDIYTIGSKTVYLQIMAWCQPDDKHYLIQWLPSSLNIYYVSRPQCVNTLRPRENGRHFADDIFKCIFANKSLWIPIKISLKFVPKGPINNIPALVQTMAWRRPGDKPLSEPMMVRLSMHICVTRPQWVKATVCVCVKGMVFANELISKVLMFSAYNDVSISESNNTNISIISYTVRCRYNAVNFLPNPHNRHPIARPWGRGMGYLLYSKIWFTFYYCYRSVVCNIVIN